MANTFLEVEETIQTEAMEAIGLGEISTAQPTSASPTISDNAEILQPTGSFLVASSGIGLVAAWWHLEPVSRGRHEKNRKKISFLRFYPLLKFS